ncbi:FAD/NAD(P)-binding domain-containing protein [Calocera cornea HHB12733]|uniref:FAD/NAD(P)-binding domain-containing protein n=1 Tax=Calocera cornea HHB12733 TaxID=1353952 RepID=A0A165D4T5_9BASI|nr:FAD/NAD(P)-binding domain-containing protein [Calocera cornea HHB12733]
MKIIVIGAGITGPLLALLLKHKGFEPVVYERHTSVPLGGLVVNLSPQVFKVLNIVGLAHDVLSLGIPVERTVMRSEITGQILQDMDLPSRVLQTTGWPMSLTIRSKYNQFLVQKMEERGIPAHWGRKLVDVQQEGGKVTAVFEDGTSDEGDVLVGCDGIHSKVRDALFGATPAEYTGVVSVNIALKLSSTVADETQIGGFTPYTEELHPGTGPATMRQVTGNGCHFICSPSTENKYFWAVNVPDESPMLEDWRTASKSQVGKMLGSLPCARWSGDTGKIIAGTEDVIRFGLYLRPIPPVWHKGRAVLLGDAAHPTTPFLGQGANQSTEDVYHLVRVLVQNQPWTDASLEKAFAEYTAIRLPRVARAIEQAKRETKYRLAMDEEALRERDAMRAKGAEGDTWKVILEMVQGPFEGTSEI